MKKAIIIFNVMFFMISTFCVAADREKSPYVEKKKSIEQRNDSTAIWLRDIDTAVILTIEMPDVKAFSDMDAREYTDKFFDKVFSFAFEQ